ncbi:hypothetical protein CRG98_023041 [Punica granatum]|uniref:Uncharacterized protein n=1 Tax=Punica granatum TaxID=22663 RepID=A0A2I0JJY6_PUNGR|nr:hypothetical protein CRG98_023041 [Punica granatum]
MTRIESVSRADFCTLTRVRARFEAAQVKACKSSLDPFVPYDLNFTRVPYTLLPFKGITVVSWFADILGVRMTEALQCTVEGGQPVQVIPDRRARGPSVELVESVYCYLEMSKLEHSRSRFAQGINHHGSTNCNAKIVNGFPKMQAYSSFEALARSDHFTEFTTSKRASQVQP